MDPACLAYWKSIRILLAFPQMGLKIWRICMKPSKKVFDLVLIVSILLKPAVGLVKLSARRWSRENSGALGVVGDAVQVGL